MTNSKTYNELEYRIDIVLEQLRDARGRLGGLNSDGEISDELMDAAAPKIERARQLISQAHNLLNFDMQDLNQAKDHDDSGTPVEPGRE